MRRHSASEEASGIVAADLSGWVEGAPAPDDGTMEGEDAAVFVQDGVGVVTPRRIRVAPGDGTRVRVLGGLEPGETVVDFAPPSQGGGGGRPPGR